MKTHFKPCLLIISIMLSLQAQLAYCAGTSAVTESVVKFQQKMAQRGHVESQYKLGFMYETAQGLKQDLQLAREWYIRAAAQQHTGAKYRLVYLNIKKNGYNMPEHNAWLSSVKKTANESEGEAALLLGQLYASGTGVPKSLTLSLNYLRIASAANIAYADSEIRRVEQELDELQESFRENDAQPLPETPQTTIESTDNKVNKPQTVISKTSVPAEKKAPPVSIKDKSVTLKTANPQPIETQETPLIPEQKKAASHPMDIICSGNNRFSQGCR